MSSDDASGNDAPGWAAIDAALAPIYGEVEPFHYGTIVPFGAGGEDPLHGISVYHRAEPSPHFHYVTYGFSDLWGDGERGGDFSKFGFELTFRLACAAEKHEPPAWPLSFLQNIARYVFKSGNHFEAGHHVNCNGPIALEEDTEIGFIAFANDPELGTIDTEYGRVEFLQIVGLCADEYETIKHWRTDRFLAILERQYPLLVTDLSRKSILNDDAILQEVAEAASKEGSLQTTVRTMDLTFTATEQTANVKLPANVVGDLLLMIDNQIPTGDTCSVIGGEQAIVWAAADANLWQVADNVLKIELTVDLAVTIRQTLRIERGEYRWPELPGLTLEVVPTEIKDQDGQVVMVIG